MSIVPARIEEGVKRMDRTRSLILGISTAVTAVWCVYRVFWAVYLAVTLSSVGWSPVSAVISIVFWGVIGVLAGFWAFVFLTRYAKHP
jgi:hypothetical protein